mmetsp:Transcript_6259/g.10543  ORF Transcript_6259/g.10543 Transcript_6259/m.10543 type:complete len:94 (-) Transcript_6259:1034-1315(-)
MHGARKTLYKYRQRNICPKYSKTPPAEVSSIDVIFSNHKVDTSSALHLQNLNHEHIGRPVKSTPRAGGMTLHAGSLAKPSHKPSIGYWLLKAP